MTAYKITSLTNPKIKTLIQLRNRKDRDQSGETIVEGYRELLRAVGAEVRLKDFYYCPELLKAYDDQAMLAHVLKLKIAMYEVARNVFEKIAYGDRQEGCLAVAQAPQFKLEDLKLQAKPFLVVVEKVEKPGNLGAILRICDGAGVDGVIVCDGQTDIYNPNAIRASLGTVFTVKVISGTNEDALKFLKSRNMKICAALPSAKDIYTQMNYNVPLAVVVGSEEEGLSPFWIKNSDFQVRIPMLGKADSLNVASSSAILLYEAFRQRNP